MIVRRKIGLGDLKVEGPELLPHLPVRQAATLAPIDDDAPAQVRQCEGGCATAAAGGPQLPEQRFVASDWDEPAVGGQTAGRAAVLRDREELPDVGVWRTRERAGTRPKHQGRCEHQASGLAIHADLHCANRGTLPFGAQSMCVAFKSPARRERRADSAPVGCVCQGERKPDAGGRACSAPPDTPQETRNSPSSRWK